MKIAVFNTKPYDVEYLSKYNEHQIEFKFFDVLLNADTVKLTNGYDGICIFVNDQVNAEVVNELAKNKVKLIVLRCAGFNNVDMEAATEKDIKVYRVPSYSPDSVAEHALALIMALNRKTHKAYNRIREGNFSLDRLKGFDLAGKTVGVIGTGKIGAIFSRIMMGIGCTVVAYDKYPSEELAKSGVSYLPLEDLLSQSDIVSLHCPLMESTKYIINKNTLSQMKDGVMVINTSRGGLINTADTLEALKSGKVGYLGIDVYEQEEQLFFEDLSESIIQDDLIMRLISFPNVLITSHQGFFTEEALQQIAITTLQNIDDFRNAKASSNQVIFEP